MAPLPLALLMGALVVADGAYHIPHEPSLREIVGAKLDRESQTELVRHADYAAHPAAMSASLLVREAPASSFLAAPAGKTQNLFIPAISRCNESLKQEFSKIHSGQATGSEMQTVLEELLRSVHTVNAELDMPTVLAAGSVLGFYRDCGVIRHDHDADTYMLGHWLQGDRSIEKLKAAYARHNLLLSSDLCPHGPQYTGCQLRITHDKQDGLKSAKGTVDVFVLATESACDEGPCSFFGPVYHGGEVHPTFNRFVTGKIHFELAEFLDKKFWIPAPTLEYLTLNYGETWDNPTAIDPPGQHKAVEYHKETTSVPDTLGENMPSPNYVRSLE